jgi:hypothetical protein
MRRLQMAAIAVLLLLSGCFGLFDNGSDNIVDNYDTMWIDIHANRGLYNGQLGVVPAYVFAVGYDSNYLFVKQHPLGGELKDRVLKSVTRYYLIRRTKSPSQDEPVYGPLKEEEFGALCSKLNIKNIRFTTHYPENI